MGDRLFRRLGLGNHAPAALVEGGAGLGQGQPPGGAVEQAQAQAVLQAADLLGDRRLGQTERPRRAGEAFRLDHAGEGRHGVESFHDSLTIGRHDPIIVSK